MAGTPSTPAKHSGTQALGSDKAPGYDGSASDLPALRWQESNAHSVETTLKFDPFLGWLQGQRAAAPRQPLGHEGQQPTH